MSESAIICLQGISMALDDLVDSIRDIQESIQMNIDFLRSEEDDE